MGLVSGLFGENCPLKNLGGVEQRLTPPENLLRSIDLLLIILISFMKKIIDIAKNIFEIKKRSSNSEKSTARYIKKELIEKNIPFTTEKFINHEPLAEICRLEADGNKLNCKNSGFSSGRIENKDILISAFSENEGNAANINFNPYSDAISRVSFYSGCAISVSRKDLLKILKAKRIKGITKVKKKKFVRENILLGNIKDPLKIVFAHYDSIEEGAVDNISGLVTLLHLVGENKKILNDNLFVFSGSEELSYDDPVYWGKGYRCFEKKHRKLLLKAERVFIIDSVGNGRSVVIKDKKLIFQAFPVVSLGKIIDKTAVISGDIEELMKYYHSSADDLFRLKEKHLVQAERILIDLLK